MRVCDRHPDKTTSMVLRDLKTGSEHDFCKECSEQFAEWISETQMQKPADTKKEKEK